MTAMVDEHLEEVKKSVETLMANALNWHDTFVRENNGACEKIHLTREELKTMLPRHFPKKEDEVLRRAILFVNDVSKRTCKNKTSHKE